ncbi:TPA: site-specific integrase [Legionella pneumophila]|uniref:tyrosine-type recombinase/integrase n=1 Tax=Legionella pneumophila TaxID=446 RepID=UPI000494720F|nr:site-specific integrase [Legionella pneumophila]HAT2150961.1 site-specific integrase [Legionella pneumophila]
MALYKRNSTWWVSFTHQGKRIQRSTGTNDKVKAQEFHDRIKAELWSVTKLENKPVYMWRDAVYRWLSENTTLKSIDTIKAHFRWLDPHLSSFQLHEITHEVLERVALKKELQGVTFTTVNRLMELVRALLTKAFKEWEWIDKVPAIRMRQVEKGRIRWLTIDEANRLLKELPPHLKDMAAFTLATGLRASNVTGLEWQNIDMVRRHAWVHPDQSKTKKAISVPLNDVAIEVLQARFGSHPKFVFTYKGNSIGKCSTRAWFNALERAGIDNFRWHDLRHTWASWHVQNGTSLQELQQLGGWSSFEMVLRYAHLSGDLLKNAANRINSLGVTRDEGNVVRF